MLRCGIDAGDHVYCAPLFSNDGLAGSLRRREIGSGCPLPESRPCAYRFRVRRTGFDRISSFLSCAVRRGPAAVDPHAGRRRQRPSGEFMLISIGVGFGIATLFATGFLFVAQMVEDFRGA